MLQYNVHSGEQTLWTLWRCFGGPTGPPGRVTDCRYSDSPTFPSCVRLSLWSPTWSGPGICSMLLTRQPSLWWVSTYPLPSTPTSSLEKQLRATALKTCLAFTQTSWGENCMYADLKRTYQLSNWLQFSPHTLYPINPYYHFGAFILFLMSQFRHYFLYLCASSYPLPQHSLSPLSPNTLALLPPPNTLTLLPPPMLFLFSPLPWTLSPPSPNTLVLLPPSNTLALLPPPPNTLALLPPPQTLFLSSLPQHSYSLSSLLLQTHTCSGANTHLPHCNQAPQWRSGRDWSAHLWLGSKWSRERGREGRRGEGRGGVELQGDPHSHVTTDADCKHW